MRSIVAVTNEMDDPKKAVDELLQQINEKGPLCKNSLGLLECDVAIANDEFLNELQKRLPFDVVGGTAMATLDSNNGVQIISIVLTVLTADDVEFSTVVSEVLTVENLRAELEASYRKASATLADKEKLIILAPSYIPAIVPDDYIDILSELSGDVPVFGGLPSSNDGSGIVMLANGHVYTDRAAIVLISGNVRPVFTVQNIIGSYSDQQYIVTKSKDSLIYTVNDMPFVDYLRSVGMGVDEIMAQGELAIYVSTPIRVHLSKHDYNDDIPVIRTIKDLNPEDGSGLVLGSVPEKSIISVGAMRRRDIQESCSMALKLIQEAIDAQSDDYKYSTLLCISCAGRYMVMANDNELEGNIIREALPQGLEFAGFYSYGEICPTGVVNGRAINRLHNSSIIMCML